MENKLYQLSDAYSFLAYESSDCDSNKSLIDLTLLNQNQNQDWINVPNDDCDTKELRQPLELTKSELSHRLTRTVRKQYTGFLKNLLHKQYESYFKNEPTDGRQTFSTNVEKFVEDLEQQALHSCMIVSLYRQKMLEMIAEVRNDKNKKKFFQILRKKLNSNDLAHQNDENDPKSNKKIRFGQPKKCVNASVQTDSVLDVSQYLKSRNKTEADLMAVSLDEKIKKFEMKLKEEERKRKQFSHFLAKKEEEIQQEKYSKKLKISTSECNVTQSPATPHLPAGSAAVPFFAPLPILQPSLMPSTCSQQIPPQLPVSDHLSTLAAPSLPSCVLAPSEIPPEIPSALLNPSNIPSLPETEDTIAQELQALFGPEDDKPDDIFSESLQNPQIEAIISEIYNSDIATAKPDLSRQQNDNTLNQTVQVQPKEVDKQINLIVNEPAPVHVDFDVELRNSLWPCELHMKRIRLRHILDSVADKGMRHNEKIRLQFIILFGEDGVDDDMILYSPSVELTDVVMSSCKKRIAPWIVKYLMQPMQDGLIANRYLFKKLAKHLAESIILLNQYPEEKLIKTAVTDYFCSHPYVGTVNDIY